MLDPYETNEALWTASSGPLYPPLPGDAVVDVAIIGAGIVGLTAAYLLQQAGRDVTVIEARRVGRQVTGMSSAKVTSQHNLIYDRLAEAHGDDVARTYGLVNQQALEQIAATVESLGIACAFERRAAYTYTTNDDRVAELAHEAETAARLGLPARFTATTSLPYTVAGAVVFGDQAQFDPYAYLRGLAEHVARTGHIYEQTRVLDIQDGAPCRITTDRGIVTATDVIVATNIPCIDTGAYFLKTSPIAHAVIAAQIDGPGVDGMFISVDDPTRSLRMAGAARDGTLLLVGPRYTPGGHDTAEAFRVLEAWLRERFPVRSIGFRWTNEDYQSIDGLPYVGCLTSDTPHTYVATGFSGWGITNGVAAATVLADTLAGRTHPAAAIFDSTRIKPPQSAKQVVSAGIAVAKAMVLDRLSPPPALDLAALKPGDGIIATVDGEQVAVSRDADGRVHAVSAACSHLGCILGWNAGMRTWDCPCHGSLFAPDGAVLHGPAVNDLESVALPQEAATTNR